ncbi:MAG: hypothetical protein QG670_2473, partial [Thermoproteota archaeon]|nr:hypothetical protein [Thermoproteota archaeon]
MDREKIKEFVLLGDTFPSNVELDRTEDTIELWNISLSKCYIVSAENEEEKVLFTEAWEWLHYPVVITGDRWSKLLPIIHRISAIWNWIELEISDNPKLTDELLEKMLSIIPTAGASNEEWEVFALEMKKYD